MRRAADHPTNSCVSFPLKAYAGEKMTARQLVTELGLEAHPEGGFYKRWYTHADSVPLERGPRSTATAIQYLLEAGGSSKLHRLQSDELWVHQRGAALVVVEVEVEESAGAALVNLRETRVGPGGVLTYTVPAGRLFGAYMPAGDDAFSLVSCVVVPGFDFRDWAMPPREEVLALWTDRGLIPSPADRIIIERLTSAADAE